MKKTPVFIAIVFLIYLLNSTFSSLSARRHHVHDARIVDLSESSVSIIRKNTEPCCGDVLEIGVGAMISPQATMSAYEGFMRYVKRRTGKKVRLHQHLTCAETNEMIANGCVNFAFICTGAFWDGYVKKQMTPLAVPVLRGKPVYKAVLVVRRDSGIHSLEDLAGKSFAFSDVLSNSGYLYPLSLLSELGLKRPGFFRASVFTHSHDRSLQAVLDGFVDAASLHSGIYELLQASDSRVLEKTRILHVSKEFPSSPIVVPFDTDKITFQVLQRLFLEAHLYEEGRAALQDLGVDYFVSPVMDWYFPKQGK